MWTEQYLDDSFDYETYLENALSSIQSGIDDEREEDGRREEYLKNGIALYNAVLREDWKSARKLHSEHSNCFAAALEARNSNFMVYLMSLFVEVDFKLTSRNKKKARVCLALASGTITVAREMICVHPELSMIRNHKDIAFEILYNCPELAVYDNEEAPQALCAMVQRPSLKSNGSQLSIWRNFFKRNRSHKENEGVQQLKATLMVVRLWDEALRQRRDCNSRGHPWKVLFTAVEVGNVEFVTTILTSYPDLIWKLNDKYQSLLHFAVQHRQEQIFSNIILMMDDVAKDLLATCVNDSNGNNILHMAALLPSPHRLYCTSGKASIIFISGDTVIAMHQEMVWFKAIEDLVQPKLGVARNLDEETPRSLFDKEHKKLKEDGKSWILDIASSAMFCITVNILITFVMLIAALRWFVKPLISHGAWYQVFVIFDSMSLISSIPSIFVFSSISASKFTEEDFLHSLPRKLMVGTSLLVISIATLVIALIATLPFFSKLGWLYLGISALACLLIIGFVGHDLPQLLGFVLQLSKVTSSLNTVTSLDRSNLIS